MQTDLNSVIGGYCPDQWEDTTGMECSKGCSDSKGIESGKPFLFYFLDDQIQIINHRDDRKPFIISYKHCLMEFGVGLFISDDKNEQSQAFADNDYWVHPLNTGNLKIRDGCLFFAGGNNWNFKCVDVEVWGLH